MKESLDILLEKYKNKSPEIVFEWQDQLTEAKGWVVINSLKGGAAGGGTRMRKGLNKEEVVSLAKVMEIKFGVCGPPIGGAKSGIDFDPRDPRRTEVLERWYAAVYPILKNYYGTGGDLNVDELKDVVPITEELGLWHPQEGIVNGHLQSNKGEIINIIGQLRYGCAKTIEDPTFAPVTRGRYAVADMITGYGVAESVVHFYDLLSDTTVKDKKVIIQGWGNVASATAYYLSKSGAKIVGIIDRKGGIINQKGLSKQEVEDLFVGKNGNEINADLIPFDELNEKIWNIQADVFIPGAASKIVKRDQIEKLLSNGLELISCGANVPFIDDKIFFGETARYLDDKLSIIPDFLANCGMARVFAYLMQEKAELTDQAIFEDVSLTIRNFIKKMIISDKSKVKLSERALYNVLNTIFA
jgi:glutamate dehydrogenase/leucine dehydrogenase